MRLAEAFLLVFVLLLGCGVPLSSGQLRVGFYSQTCPNAEAIVRSVVREATKANTRVPPILVRLQFHDCLVQGCDDSVQIENGDTERNAPQHAGLGGLDEIDKAKTQIENQCTGVVSCSDIVTMAARDAIALAGGPVYQVETGRRDGRVSRPSLAVDIPEVNEPVSSLQSKFKNKGFSAEDLVLLSGGAHTFGTTACFFMTDRLYRFNRRNSSRGSDPAINPKILPLLKRRCPMRGNVNVRIPLGPITIDAFDNQGMRNVRDGFSFLASDARLNDDADMRRVVDFYSEGSSMRFSQDFARAMVRMGRIGVKTGAEGEIRKVCGAFNE